MPAVASRREAAARGTGGPEQGVRHPGARCAGGGIADARGAAVELVARRAEQQRYAVPVYGQSIGYGHRKDVVADERTEHERVVVAGFAAQEMDALLDAFHREAAETGTRRRHAEPVAEPYDEVARGVFARLEETAGQADRAVEATTAGGRGEQREHRSATCRLAGDGDPARITAERRDVLPHPVEREQQVAQPEVRGYAVQRGEPVHAEPVAGRHGDDAVAGEGAAVVPRAGRAAREEAAAVDPHQHGAGLRPSTGATTLRFSTSSPGTDGSGMVVVANSGTRCEVAPCREASNGCVNRPRGTGAANRRAPTGASAKGMPRKRRTRPVRRPMIVPAGASTTSTPLHRGHRIPVPATPCTK